MTYTTASANLMLREVGITIFLACVGIGAGDGFVDTLVRGGGASWVGYGFLITFLPLMAVGVVARRFFRLNYFTLMGLLAGSTTDPPRPSLRQHHRWQRRPSRQLRHRLPPHHVPARAHGPADDPSLHINRSALAPKLDFDPVHSRGWGLFFVETLSDGEQGG